MCFNFVSLFLKSWLTTDVEVAVDVYSINSNCIEPGKKTQLLASSLHMLAVVSCSHTITYRVLCASCHFLSLQHILYKI